MICALSTILSWDGLHNNIVKHESPECNATSKGIRRHSETLYNRVYHSRSSYSLSTFVEEEEPLNWSRKTVGSLTQPQVSLFSPCYCIPAVRSIQLSERLVSAKTSGWL